MSKLSENPVIKTFSRKVIHERYRRGLSQEALAVMGKCAIRTIQRLESGSQSPTLPLALELAKALEISLDDL